MINTILAVWSLFLAAGFSYLGVLYNKDKTLVEFTNLAKGKKVIILAALAIMQVITAMVLTY